MRRPLQRLTKRHANALGVLTGLAIVISILLAAERNLLNSIYIAATVGANPASMSAAAQGDPFAPCIPAAANAIACENSKPGTPSGAWDVAGALQAGYAAAFVARPGKVLYPLAPKPDIVASDLGAVTRRVLELDTPLR